MSDTGYGDFEFERRFLGAGPADRTCSRRRPR